MSKVFLTVNDLKKITQILEKFPEVRRVEIREYAKCELGSCIDISFDSTVNTVDSRVTVTISDESEW